MHPTEIAENIIFVIFPFPERENLMWFYRRSDILIRFGVAARQWRLYVKNTDIATLIGCQGNVP